MRVLLPRHGEQHLFTVLSMSAVTQGCLSQVIMATNRIDILDSALLRPGRIDRKIEFPPPNEEVRLLRRGSPFSCNGFYNILILREQARLDILKIHSRKMNLTRGINLRKIAELMPGASGAEVKVRICCILYISIVSYTQMLTRTSGVFARAFARRQGCML